MESFDLLPFNNKNDIFRVAFDFYTPRPQFVILPKNVESVRPEFSAMSAEQTCILIEAVQSVLSSFKIPAATLSLHRGSWKSKPAKSFHCHLYVEPEKYLEIFERKKKAIPNWPSVAYVTRQWGWNKDPHSYAQNVRGYPYKSRFKEDVASVLQLMQDATISATYEENKPGLQVPLRANEPVSQAPFRANETLPQASLKHRVTTIVFHPSHPKIGFLGRKDASVYDLHEILWTIESFAREHGLTDTDSDDKNNGCHVCLYLGPAPPDWNITDQSTSEYDIVGYLVTSGPRFYQMCPPELQKTWFDRFQRSNFKCFT